ncbi:MAG: hypothetical protein ACM3SV_11110 [Betaproteobacteria bacterium]
MNPDAAPFQPPLGDDAFGDRFALERLPLARPGSGYAVQRLDTDTLLDRRRGDFLPVRDSRLEGLFDSFDAAHAAASEWIRTNGISPEEHPLAIVPAFFDERLQRHVLIHGVLRRSP